MAIGTGSSRTNWRPSSAATTTAVAVVTGVLEPKRGSARRCRDGPPRAEIDDEQSTVRHAFAEFSPVAHGHAPAQVHRHPDAVARRHPGVDDDELTVHRPPRSCASPARRGGASSPWHSDFTGYEPLPDERLRPPQPRRGAERQVVHLNGAHPRRGSLAIVAESHLELRPPPGFRWADGRARSSLERLKDDGEWVSVSPTVGLAYACHDSGRRPSLPTSQRFRHSGCPDLLRPAGLIIFAARTMHAAFPVPDDFRTYVTRWALGCGHSGAAGGLRGGDGGECPWPSPTRRNASSRSARGTCAAPAPLPPLRRSDRCVWSRPQPLERSLRATGASQAPSLARLDGPKLEERPGHAQRQALTALSKATVWRIPSHLPELGVTSSRDPSYPSRITADWPSADMGL